MKEEKKKVAPKKTTAKKTNSTKKAAVKKTSTTAKKTTAKKTSTTPKKNASVKSVETKKVEVKEVASKKEENKLNRDLVMKSVILIAYTLIIIFLVMGFVDYLTKGDTVVKKKEITSYVLSNEYFSKSNVIELEDASFKLSSLSGDYFIYISYSDKEVNEFEKKLVELLSSKKLKNKFYYVNIDKIKEEKNVVDLVNKYLNFRDALVTKVPTVVYVDSENIVRIENIISRTDNNIISINDVQSLLDRNGF